jgi:signal transduction histidine kinase
VPQKSDLIAQLAAGLCEFCFENTPLTRERATLYLPHVDAEGIHNLGIPPDLATALPLRSIIMVPLYYRSESLGAMTLVASEGEREFGQEDLALARDFGRRISAAIENAVLYRRVQKAVRARDEFLSIGSHELKTPVTSIQLQVQLLMASLRDNADANLSRERILRSLESTDAQVSRLVRLINELLDVSRLTTGNLRLEREPADFAALVGEVVGRFRINHSNVPLVFDGPQPVRGQWDKMRLEQVATNLISNAIKYGNGKEVTVRVYREGDRAKLTVRDLGIGIPESDVDRIFGRFERAVSARNFAGLGMGLYIVKQIVEAHGGTIHVESQPGKGSTFTVELPLAE